VSFLTYQRNAASVKAEYRAPNGPATACVFGGAPGDGRVRGPRIARCRIDTWLGLHYSARSEINATHKAART